MGSGISKQAKASTTDNTHNIGNVIAANKSAVMAIGSFSKHRVDIQRRRMSLMIFTRKMKREKQQVYCTTKIRSTRPTSGDRVDTHRETDSSGEQLECNTRRVMAGSSCFLCDVPFEMDEEYKGVVCRVCAKSFHVSCLYDCHDCHKSILKSIYYADTRIGWSCFVCSDLTMLLKDSEVLTLTEQFESCDLNKDGTLTMDEYLRYKADMSQKMDGLPLTYTDKRYFQHRFKFMDMDGDDKLDWWEFLVNEARNYLANRDPNDLVNMLTNREIAHARSVFDAMDKNKRGEVSHLELKKACNLWYQSIDEDKTYVVSEEDESTVKTELREDETPSTGVVTWNEFIRGQALLIVTSRPNCFYTLQKHQASQ